MSVVTRSQHRASCVACGYDGDWWNDPVYARAEEMTHEATDEHKVKQAKRYAVTTATIEARMLENGAEKNSAWIRKFASCPACGQGGLFGDFEGLRAKSWTCGVKVDRQEPCGRTFELTAPATPA